MGLLNEPSNLLDRMVKLERGLEAVRKLAGLTSAIISRGGLTLLNDSFIKMISSLGFQILYIGPGSVAGKQIIEIRRHNGSLVFATTVHMPNGEQFWALTDRGGRILISDDADSGVGLASPWFSVPLYPYFSMAASSTWPYMNLPVASVTSETVLWSGRIPQMLHGFVGIDGVWGQASGSNSSTYKLKLNGTTVGTWSPPALEVAAKGPFNANAFIGQQWVGVDLTVQASGTGNVACQVAGCATRGS